MITLSKNVGLSIYVLMFSAAVFNGVIIHAGLADEVANNPLGDIYKTLTRCHFPYTGIYTEQLRAISSNFARVIDTEKPVNPTILRKTVNDLRRLSDPRLHKSTMIAVYAHRMAILENAVREVPDQRHARTLLDTLRMVEDEARRTGYGDLVIPGASSSLPQGERYKEADLAAACIATHEDPLTCYNTLTGFGLLSRVNNYLYSHPCTGGYAAQLNADAKDAKKGFIVKSDELGRSHYDSMNNPVQDLAKVDKDYHALAKRTIFAHCMAILEDAARMAQDQQSMRTLLVKLNRVEHLAIAKGYGDLVIPSVSSDLQRKLNCDAGSAAAPTAASAAAPKANQFQDLTVSDLLRMVKDNPYFTGNYAVQLNVKVKENFCEQTYRKLLSNGARYFLNTQVKNLATVDKSYYASAMHAKLAYDLATLEDKASKAKNQHDASVLVHFLRAAEDLARRKGYGDVVISGASNCLLRELNAKFQE